MPPGPKIPVTNDNLHDRWGAVVVFYVHSLSFQRIHDLGAFSFGDCTHGQMHPRVRVVFTVSVQAYRFRLGPCFWMRVS